VSGPQEIARNLEQVRSALDRAAGRAGRDPRGVAVMAVTKNFTIAEVQAACSAGLNLFGENRVQEAEAKYGAQGPLDGAGRPGRPGLPPLSLHLIGHLQRNKARLVVGRFVLVHSLDSLRLADALAAAAAAAGVVQDVLVQVNVAREPQKSGISPEEAAGLVAHAAGLAHLRLRGLMTIAPFTADPAVQRDTFRGLRALRDTLATSSLDLAVLSMGMSNDFEVAVEEGATMVRLGTILFGERES
jgi:pyridoxal phosphate enzyme (YggS family)